MTHDGSDLAAHAAREDLPRLIRFRDLPRQSLHEGKGVVREIWTETDPGLNLRWQLQLIELRGPGGSLVAPAGTHQRIVGLSGPQVAIGDADRSSSLGRDRALLVRSSTVVFQRPRLRVAGASTVLVLTFAAVAVPPMFSFHDLNGSVDLPSGSRAVLNLKGDLRVGGVDAPRQAALLLDPRADRPGQASSARVLVLSEAVIAQS
jgi:hypothetical protein